MLEYSTGFAPLPLSIGAAACLLCLLVLMGLKLRWFRARMTFDEPDNTPAPYAGVYRSTFSDDVFDYRRPSTHPEPPSAALTAPPSKAKSRPLSAPSYAASPVASSSKNEYAHLNVNGMTATKVRVKNETKPSSPLEKSSVRFPLFRSKSKEHKGEESLVSAVKVKESKTKVKQPSGKEAKSKESKTKTVQSQDPAVKQTKSKEPQTQAAKTKEPKTKDANVKTSKPKEAKNKGGKTQAPPLKSQISQNNAFPYVSQPRAPPMPQERVASLDDNGFVVMRTKGPPPQQQNTMPPTMKTFGTIQPTKGQSNPMVTPIPSQESRGFRNPAAMGMSAYKSPKALSDSTFASLGAGGNATRQQLYYGMEEESES